VATGCYAGRAPQELAQIEGVDLVLGNEEKPHLLQRLEESGYLHRPVSVKCNLVSCRYAGFRTRAFIKVQDGCQNFCAYCIVPLVRLTGTKIGSYNYDGVNLRGLIARILADTGVTRLRLSSLQPQEISPEFIGLWRDDRLCRHFHLSLQSGSDGVLGRMRRRYSIGDYQGAVSLVRALVPEVAITTDIIVGFPGETETEFKESYDFCRHMQFARLHVFPYSSRQETEAARMPHKVSDRVKKERSQKMLTLAKESIQNFSQRFLGKTMTVLWEKRSNGLWSGHTDNYIKVYTKSGEDLTNKLLPVKLEEVRDDRVWGVNLAAESVLERL